MDLLDALHDRFRGEHVAEAPTGNRVRLAQAAAFDSAFEHPRERRNIRMAVGRIDNMFVNLVRNHVKVVFYRQGGDYREFFAGKDLPARVRGVAQHERLHARLLHGAFQNVGIEAQIHGRKRHVNRSRPAENRVGGIILVKRRKKHDFIARIANRHHRGHHGLGTATRNDDFLLRVVAQPAKA